MNFNKYVRLQQNATCFAVEMIVMHAFIYSRMINVEIYF